MRLPVIILLTVLTANAKDVLMHRVHLPLSGGTAGYDTIEFRVEEASLTAFGEWEPGGGKAPAVTRNQAVRLALESAGVKPGSTAGRALVSLQKVNKWEIGTKTLPEGCSPWYYLIELQNAPRNAKDRYFLVTVGGTVAQAAETD